MKGLAQTREAYYIMTSVKASLSALYKSSGLLSKKVNQNNISKNLVQDNGQQSYEEKKK